MLLPNPFGTTMTIGGDMAKNVVEKIFEAHKVYGNLKVGMPVGLKVDRYIRRMQQVQ